MLGFVRDRHSVGWWLQALALVLPVIVLTATAQELVLTRHGVLQTTEIQMARLDMVFAEQTARALDTLDQVLRATADAMELLQDEGPQSLARLNQRLRRRTDRIRQIAGLAVADPSGRPLISTFPDMTDSFRSQMEAMISDLNAQSAPAGPEAPRISKPFRNGAGPWMALMTRRVTQPDGALRGYAVGFIRLSYFEDFYQAVRLGQNGAIVLHLRDGTVLARYPHLDAIIGSNFADRPPFRDILSKAEAGTMDIDSPIDGLRRVLAIRALRSYPIAISVSVGEAKVLRGWVDQAVVLGIMALAASLLTSGMLLLLASRVRGREAMAKNAVLAAERRLQEQMAEHERAAEALRQAQRIEAVGLLTGGLAHDFNNLLTVVLSNVEMLEDSGQFEGDGLRMLNNARAAAERGAIMTGQLLAFSRQQPLKPAPVALNVLVRGMANLLRGALGEAVKLDLQLHARSAVMVDPNQMELVVFNLALNARDAMPDGGTLTIETSDATRGAPDAPEQPPEGDYVMIMVRDTGTGMTSEVRGRAFDPFFTTKGPGTGSGLGLSQVYGLVQQSGGLAELDSQSGEGTTVRVWLPRADAAVLAAPIAPVAGSAVQPKQATILVVDDDPAVREATVRILRRAGYTVLEDDGAGHALARMSGGAAVSLVLSDIVMPGMTGLDLAREVRRLRPALPVVFISGYTDPVHVTAGSESLRLIRKPFRSAELIAQIQAALAEAAGQDAQASQGTGATT